METPSWTTPHDCICSLVGHPVRNTPDGLLAANAPTTSLLPCGGGRWGEDGGTGQILVLPTARYQREIRKYVSPTKPREVDHPGLKAWMVGRNNCRLGYRRLKVLVVEEGTLTTAELTYQCSKAPVVAVGTLK